MTEHIGAVSFLLTLDRRQFDSDLQNLASTDRALPVGLKINPQEIREQLKQSRMPALKMGVELDSRGVEARLAKLGANRVLSLRVAVDDRRLYALNKHFSLKEQHHRQLQRYFDSRPLTVRVNDAALVKLERVLVGLERSRSVSVTTSVNSRALDLLETQLKSLQSPRKASLTVVTDTRSIVDLSAAVKDLQAQTSGIAARTVKPVVDASSIVSASVQLSRFQAQFASIKSSSGASISLRVQHSVDTGNLDRLFGATVNSFEKSGDRIGKAIADRVSRSKVTAVSRGGVLGGIVGSFVRGGVESLGSDFVGGLGLRKKSRNAGVTAKQAAKAINEYVLDVEEMTAAFLAEFLRSGNPMKGMDSAIKASKGAKVAAQFGKTMEAAGKFDPSAPGMDSGKAKKNLKEFVDSLTPQEISVITRKYVESNQALLNAIKKETGLSKERILSDIDGAFKAAKTSQASKPKVSRQEPKPYWTKQERQQYDAQKDEDEALRKFTQQDSLQDFIRKNSTRMMSPIVTAAAQREVPTEFIQGFVNPALKQASKVTDFVSKIQAHRTVYEAEKVKNNVLPLFPELKQGQKGYVQMIGGAQFAGGEGHRKLTAWGEGLFPDRRVIGVANPDLDPGSNPPPLTNALYKAFAKVAPAIAEDKELKNTVMNAITMLSGSINPAGYSPTVATALGNMMAARERGADMSQFSTTSYSLGGVAARQLAEVQGRAGFNTNVHALAFPDINPAQRHTPNFTASVIEADALASFKTVLGLGGDQNLSTYNTGAMPGAAAHAPQHYFKYQPQIDDYYQSTGVNAANSGSTAKFVALGQNFYEMLGASAQVRHLSTAETPGFDPSLPVKAFSSGENAIGDGAGLIAKYIESLSKLTGGSIDEIINNVDAEPAQRAIAQKVKEHILATYPKFVKFLADQGFDISEETSPDELKAKFAGVPTYQKEHKSFNAVKRSFAAGKVAPEDEKHSWFVGNFDKATLRRRMPDVDGAISHFSNPNILPDKDQREKIVGGFKAIKKMMEEFIEFGRVSKATIDSIPDFEPIAMSAEFEKLLSAKFSSEDSPSIESQRRYKQAMPQWAYKSPSAVVAYNRMLSDTADSPLVPPAQQIKFAAYGMSGATALIDDDHVYKNDIGDPAKVASKNEVAAYEQLAGRFAPLLEHADPGKLMISERIKGMPAKDYLDKIAAPAKQRRETVGQIKKQVDQMVQDGLEPDKELVQQLELAEKKFAKSKALFNKQAADLYRKIGQLGTTFHSMGVAHNDLASGNVFMMPDGSLTAIDLGNSTVNPDLGARLSDQATTMQRAVVDSAFWGILDPMQATNAVREGYAMEPLPLPEKRKAQPLPQYSGNRAVEYGSNDQSFMEYALGDYRELAEQYRQQQPEAMRRRVAEELPAFAKNLDNPWDDNQSYSGATAATYIDSLARPDGRNVDLEDPWKSKEEIQQERLQRRLQKSKKRVQQGLDAAKSGATAVKNFVVNPDRNLLTIDMDKMRDRVEKTGIVLYQSGLAIAKTMDAANNTLNALAQSNIGQSFLGGLGQATAAIGGVAKASYALAAGMESIALDLTPGGRMLKGALKQTAVPALAFGAATHFLPGGQMVAGAMGDFAQGALSPIGHSIAGNLSGGAVDLIGQAVPNIMGLQTQIAGAVSGAIEGAMSAVTSGVAAAAVPILGGKAIQTAAGKALPQMTLPQSNQFALPAAKNPALSPAQDSSMMTLPAAQSGVMQPQKMGTLRKQMRDRARKMAQEAKKTEKQINQAIADGNTSLAESLLQSLLNNEVELKDALTEMRQEIAAPDKTTKRMQDEISAAKGQITKITNRIKNGLAVAALRKQEIESNQAIDVSATPVRDREGLARVSDQGLFGRLKDKLTSKSEGAIAASALVPKIVETRQKFAGGDAEGLARQSSQSPVVQVFDILRKSIKGDDVKRKLGEVAGAAIGLGKAITLADSAAAKSQALKKFVAPEEHGLARSSGRFDPMAFLSRFRRKRDDSAIQSNYEKFSQSAAKSAGVEFNQAEMPQLKVDSEKLKKLGAEAYYDVQKNTIIINDLLAQILSKAPDELHKFAEKLKPLTHEIRHSQQLDSGAMEIEQAALQPRVKLRSEDGLSRKQRGQVKRSAQNYRENGGQSDTKSVQTLETDAYSFEGETAGILARFSNKERNLFSRFVKLTYRRQQRVLELIADDIDNAIEDAEGKQKAAIESGDKPTARRMGALAKKLRRRKIEATALAEKNDVSEEDAQKIGAVKSSIGDLYKGLGRKMPKAGFILEAQSALGALAGAVQPITIAFGAAFFAGQQFIQLMQGVGNEAIQAAIAADKLNTSLNFTTRGKAKETIAFADSEAERLGVSRSATIDGMARISAAGRGKISEADQRELMTGLSMAGTTFGMDREEMTGATNAVAQMLSKGKVQAEELRGQLGERLPGAFGIAAKSMGMSEEELNKQLELGNVSAKDFVPKFAKQLQAEFGAGAEEAGKNLQSSLIRLENAMERLKIASGSAIAPAFKVAVDAAAMGVNGLSKAMEFLGKVMPALVGAGTVMLVGKLGGLGAILGNLGKLAVGAIGSMDGFAGLGAKLLPALGVAAKFVGKMIAVQAAIEAAGAINEIVQGDEQARKFNSTANSMIKDLERIRGESKLTFGALNDLGTTDQGRTSKGVDLTFGLGGFIANVSGIEQLRNGIRTDDAISGVNRAFGTEFSTMADMNYNKKMGALDRQDAAIEDAGGLAKDPAALQGLRRAREIDKQLEQITLEKAKIAATPGKANNEALEKLRKEETKLSGDRESAAAKAKDAIKFFDQQISNKQEEIKANQDSKESEADKTSIGNRLQQQLEDLQSYRKALAEMEDTSGAAADRTLKFNSALAELSLKLEDVSRQAENAFNASEVGRLQKSEGRFKSDSEASLKDAEESAANQTQRARAELEGQKKYFDELAKSRTPQAESDLAKIAVPGTGRVLSFDSSLTDLESAKKGAKDEATKEKIDNIINFRKAKDALPGFQKNALEAQLQERETKQRNAFERMDRKSQQRDLTNKTSETADAINLNNKIGLGKVTDTQADIERAKMSAKSARAQKANIDEQLTSLEDYYQKGIVSAEEYEKRKRDLQLRGLDAVKQISDAELQVRQAANRKALDDFERSNRRRDLNVKKADAADAINIAQMQMDNRTLPEDIEIAKSQATLRGADREASSLNAQAAGLKSLREQGVLDANQYADRMMEIEGRMVDLTVRQAEARLAAQQAANRKALEDFEQAARQRESINKRLQASEQIGLLDRRRTKDINSEDAAIEQQDVNLRATAREDLELSNKKRDLEIKYSSRLINRKDYDAQKRELTDQKTEIDTKRAEQNLSRQEAVDSKAINESSRQVQEQRMGAEMAFSQRTGSIRLLQAKTGILAGEGGQQALDKVEGENTRSRMAIIEQEMAANDELFANRNIDEIAYNQKSLELASQLQQEKAKLIDLEIKQREYAALAASDAAKRQTDGIIMQLDREKGAIDGVIKVMQDRQSLLSTQLELSRTSAEARTSQLEIRSGRATEAADLMAKLQDPSTGQSMRGLLQKQLGELGFGAADPAQALRGKLAIEQELAREKLTALQEQQGLERNILELKILQERSSAKSAEIEARKNAQLAQKAKLDADLSLAQARMSGDANQIANAESAAKIAGDGINLAAEQTKLAAESLSYKEQEFELQRRILGLKEGMDTSRLTAESAAKRRSGERELGEALAKVEAKNVTINNGVINNGSVTNNIKPEDKPKEAPKAWDKAWQEANKSWESAKFGGKDWDTRFGGFDPSSVGGGGSGAAVSIGGGGGIQANTVIGGQNTAPRFSPMGAGSAMDSPGNKIQVRYEPANLNNDELVRASNSMVPVDRSAQVDKNVMQAGSDRVVKAIDNLGGKVEKLANTPRSLSFSTPEPVNDYADFMNQQTRALG